MDNEEGVRVGSMVPVDIKTLPAGSVKIFKGTEEVGEKWSTTDATPGTVTFIAKVGERASSPKNGCFKA